MDRIFPLNPYGIFSLQCNQTRDSPDTFQNEEVNFIMQLLEKIFYFMGERRFNIGVITSCNKLKTELISRWKLM